MLGVILMSFYIPTTKSVLDKNRFMDRPNRDESGQNPTQGLFLTNLIRSTQAIFQVPVIPSLINIELTETRIKSNFSQLRLSFELPVKI